MDLHAFKTRCPLPLAGYRRAIKKSYGGVRDQPSTIWPTPLKSRSTRADEAQDFVMAESGSGRYCFNPAAQFSTSVMGEPASSPTDTSRRKRWPIPLPTHFGAEATVIDG